MSDEIVALDVKSRADINGTTDSKTYDIEDTHSDIWEDTHVHLLQSWKAQAFVHLWTQAASQYMFRRLYTVLSFPILIISTITGTIVYSENKMTKYAISALSLIMAILSSLQRQIRPSERAQEHATYVQKYNIIIRNINTTLSLPEDQRPDPGTFIQNVKEQLDTLANTQAEPPEFILYYFNRRFKVSVEKALYGDSLQELLQRDQMIVDTFQQDERPPLNRFKSFTMGVRQRMSAASQYLSPIATRQTRDSRQQMKISKIMPMP